MAESHEALLAVTLRHRQGAHTLDVSFRTGARWTLLFGPSGSGKSTVLRVVSGFVTPDAGSVIFRSTVLLDTARKHICAPHQRPVRSAPQSARLIPHRRVLANLRYGLGGGAPDSDQREMLEALLDLFRIRSLTDRLPDELSGGEVQRVSVARAVLSAATCKGEAPPLLLLDEPFSGLDTALRDELAPELHRWLAARNIPVLSVSHDIAEAFLLDAEVLRIADGRIVEQGSAQAVLAVERQRLLRHLQI